MASLSRFSGEPLARYNHAAVYAGRGNMLVFAGVGDGSALQTCIVDSLNVLSMTWEDQRQLNGQSLPDGLRNMAFASDGERAYLFGGLSGSMGLQKRCSSLYQVDLMSLECRELVPANGSLSPSARSGCGMVLSEQRTLVVYGGLTAGGCTDELLVFDLDANMWTAQATTGERPPLLVGHTLTKCDHNRAILFGARAEGNYRNDTYVLDMDTWTYLLLSQHWSKVRTTGKEPCTRYYHAACCISDAQHSLLMVVGGLNAFSVFSDVWLLDMAGGSWSEVTLPTKITQRWGHTAVVLGNDFRVIVLFGGKTVGLFHGVISETTLLFLFQNSGSWVVDRVVGPEELGVPDHTLMEQMTGQLRSSEKQITHPPEKETVLRQQIQQVRQRAKLAEARAIDVERKLQDVEQKLAEEQDRWRDAEQREKSEVDKKIDPVKELSIQTDIRTRDSEGALVKLGSQGREVVEENVSLDKQETQFAKQTVLDIEEIRWISDKSAHVLKQQTAASETQIKEHTLQAEKREPTLHQEVQQVRQRPELAESWKVERKCTEEQDRLRDAELRVKSEIERRIASEKQIKEIILQTDKRGSILRQQIQQARQRAELAEARAIDAESKLQEVEQKLAEKQDIWRDAQQREKSEMDNIIECEKQIKGQDEKISTLCQEVEEQFAGEQDRCMDTEHREDSGMDKIIDLAKGTQVLPIQRDVRPRNSEEVLFKTKVQGPKVVEWVYLEEQEMQCAEQTALDMEVVEHASIHMLKQQIPDSEKQMKDITLQAEKEQPTMYQEIQQVMQRVEVAEARAVDAERKLQKVEQKLAEEQDRWRDAEQRVKSEMDKRIAEKESTLCQEIWQIRQRAELAEVKAVYAEKKLQELVGEQDLQRDAALREQSQMDKKRDPVNDIHEFSIQTDVKARHSEGVFVKTNVQGREVEDQESLQEQESRNVEQIVLVNEVEGHVPDISVQMLQQQAPEPLLSCYPHHHYDDQFPGVCFLGKSLEYSVQSKAVTISPPGLGISMNIPPDAVPPEKCVNITLRPCFTGSFQYPEGYELLSAVYHISANLPFQKNIEIVLEHFGELETEEQASKMTFFSAKSSPVRDDGGLFQFNEIEGGIFVVGEHHGTYSSEHICCFLSAGTDKSIGTRKRYVVLASYTNEVKDLQHAAIAISVEDSVHIMNFLTSLNEEWNLPFLHRICNNVFFQNDVAEVNYPSDLIGWKVVPSSSPLRFSQEDVDSMCGDLSMYDYPPRFTFVIKPTVNAEPSTCQLGVTGMTKDINFLFILRCRRNYLTALKIDKPDLITLMKLSSSKGGVINIIEESASKYREIGAILLDDRHGVKVKNIRDSMGSDIVAVREIYRQWMQEDMNYSWIKLTQCFRDCKLNILAHEIEQHFGLPSPLDNMTHNIEQQPTSQQRDAEQGQRKTFNISTNRATASSRFCCLF